MQEEMTAGAELDQLVAEKVMGFKRYGGKKKELCWIDDPNDRHMPLGPGVVEVDQSTPLFDDGYKGPSFSTDISAAWMVVEKCMKDGMYPTIMGGEGSWIVIINNYKKSKGRSEKPSLPLAICLAALRAVEAIEVKS